MTLVSKPQEYEVNPYPPLYFISNSLKVGDSVYDGGGKKTSEVIKVDNIDAGGQRRYIILQLKVFGIYDRRTHQYRLNDTVLQIGRNIDFSISNTIFSGMISYIGTQQNQNNTYTKKMTVKLYKENLIPWQASTYNNNFWVTNTNNEEVFRIQSVEVVPAVKSVPTDNGELKKSYDPYYKDVYITANVSVTCSESVCFFSKQFPVRIGEKWNIYSRDNKIEGAQVMEVIQNEADPT